MNNSEVRHFRLVPFFYFFPENNIAILGDLPHLEFLEQKAIFGKAECEIIRDGTFVVPQKQEREVIHCCSAIGNRKNSAFLMAGSVVP
ncbi:hypothetical protein CEXT_289821 [Caerostris extrusa]|uniref:Uncharacterized protein n=1 Tax=Caerostris extrusa TaxID=172846 RepID=A0AAV4N7V0_CAEEX|nr:hypothetical protein CEXT_289821 [Caerostris extrusa]